jgi:FAD/FMN-containing dehydrogenase
MERTRLNRAEAALDPRHLRATVAGEVFVPGDAGWDEARLAWNLAVDQQPAAVAVPASANDVVEIVRFASAEGYRVAPQGTGHGASAFGDLDDTILVKLHRLEGVTIDPAERTARVQAGAIWIEVVEAAAEHGLAALAGSSPDVGVVGYTLGGGLSFLGRRYGIGANHVTAAEIVTADGELRRIDRENDPDLFWAIRGGGGDFGIVTALEFELFPHTEVYAGILWFPVERAAEVLRAWRDWTTWMPDEMTSIGRIMQFPPLPVFPPEVSGKSFSLIEVVWSGDPAEGEALVQPLRELGPVRDTVATIPMPALSQLHMDPEHPVPGAGDGGTLTGFDDDAIDAFVSGTVGKPILSSEVRHLGGAIARASADHGALAAFDAPYIQFSVGIAPTPEAKAAVQGAIGGLRASLEPWAAPHTYLNFSEEPRDGAQHFTETAHHRLRRIKATYDPANVIRSNHPV